MTEEHGDVEERRERGTGQWREWADKFTYRRPYHDRWGALHDPTTSWDELLKYYQHDIVLRVSQATRRKAKPAWVGAEKLIRREERRKRRNKQRAHELEAHYLKRTHRRKHWKRRRRNRKGLVGKTTSWGLTA